MEIENNIFNELSTGVLVLDKTLKVLLLNSSAQTLLDVTKKNAKDDFIGNLFFEEPESFTVFKECLEDKRSFTKVDALLNLKSGKTLLCDYQLTPTSNSKGNNFLLIEITSKEFSSEIKERLRNQTNQRITTDFIRGLAHEIKNPLSGIRGSAQLLSNKLEEEPLKEYTNLIINQTDRLSALVDNILGPSRKPKFELENIHNILEDIISLTKNEMDSQGISISRDYDPSIPELIIDNYLLEQGVINLLKNAKEALIDSESLNPKIKISTRILHQEFLGNSFYSTVCKISITDNGPGIPENIKDSLFFPMISGKDSGSGLGLSITQGIVSQHKGVVKYESKPGKTTFSILIPVEKIKSHSEESKELNGKEAYG
ncbi:MAG: PAS domain-containing sensor histidine kinase [Candidatus Marinimicrobia bacterium]|nr:PAS domain-containing sensor histidine kinase [Candidatus Neomarinimicrobiota bacterium]